MIAAMGLEPGTVDETCALEPARPTSRRRSASSVGEPVSALRRVRTADGRRVVDVTDWCRADVLAPGRAMAPSARARIYSGARRRAG